MKKLKKLNFFSLGIYLMNRLTYRKKFNLILILFLIPFIAVLTTMINELNNKINFAEKERLGIVYISELTSLVQLIQQHRGLSSVYLQGGTEVKGDIEARQQKITIIVKEIDQINGRLSEDLQVESRWEDLKKEWQSITTNVYSYNTQESVALHSQLIKKIFDFQMYLATTSNLILDPDQANYFLVGTVIEELPKMSEYMGVSRAIGSAVVESKQMKFNEEIDLTFNLKGMENRFEATVTKFGFAFLASPEVENELQAEYIASRDASSNTIKLVEQQIVNAKTITIDTNKFFTEITDAIDSVYSLIEKGSSVLDNRLEDQIKVLKFQRNTTLVISIFITLLIIYFFISFYLGVRNTIMHIKGKMEQFADGDLTVKTALSTKDETKEIGKAFNKMAEDFRIMVFHNKEISEHLAGSSEELTASIEVTTQAIQQVTQIIEGVANGAEIQVNGANESAKASENMAEAIQRIATSSSTVSELSTITSEKAEKGRTSVNNSVKQFNQIQEFVFNVSGVIKDLNLHSQEISNISSLINGVAEQTNLLALNAAIEAARAGEHGKGFSVVANEVRKLAEETKLSTNKITHIVNQVQESTEKAVKMMEKGTIHVEVGSQVVESLGLDFEDILVSINTVSQQVHEVSAVSQQLSANSQEVAASVAELSHIAQDNSVNCQNVAATTEEQLATMQEINSSASELSVMAQKLSEMISKFRLS